MESCRTTDCLSKFSKSAPVPALNLAARAVEWSCNQSTNHLWIRYELEYVCCPCSRDDGEHLGVIYIGVNFHRFEDLKPLNNYQLGSHAAEPPPPRIGVNPCIYFCWATGISVSINILHGTRANRSQRGACSHKAFSQRWGLVELNFNSYYFPIRVLRLQNSPKCSRMQGVVGQSQTPGSLWRSTDS